MKNSTVPPMSVAAGEATSLRPRKTLVSVAAALALASLAGNAHALGFGRMNVQSALGQPLRAEVELTDARGENLKAGLAPASVYAQKGVEYNAAVRTIRSSIRHLPNGRAVLVLSSDAPINDPFVDVVLQASDGSGSVTRDFSILLDPPAYVKAPAPVVAPVVPAPATTVRTAPVVPREPVVLPPGDADFAVEKPVVRKSTRTAKRARNTGTARAAAGQVRVRTGQTTSQIAAANRPARVSLDQMMVAMLHANPNAFINGNVNYLKSGVTLRIPTANEVRSVSATEARTMIVAQSEDFRNYRGRLARAPMAQATPSAQQSGGKVQTQVEDKKTAPATAPDTLTITKPEVSSSKPTEQRMADALQKKDNQTRSDELNKNLSDLKKLSNEAAASAQASGTAKAPIVVPPVPGMAAASAASAPVAAASTPEELAAKAAALAASQAAQTASAAASAAANAASQAVAAASAAVSAPAKPASKPRVKAPPPAPVEEPSFLASLLENPLMLGGLGLALVGGLGYVFMKRRRNASAADDANSSFLESGLNPDSFFHASGGKEVDTSETSTAGHAATDQNQSSMLYSPSQLDAEADVDPVSEADVYLAYGRDIQAEEILKDALLKQPGRIPVHAKLLEIYARRRDVKAYAQGAATFKQLTNGVGAEWDVVRNKGAEIDPGNPLYGGAPAAPVPAAPPSAPAPNAAVVAGAAAGAAAAAQVVASTAPPQPLAAPVISNDLVRQPSVSPSTMPVTPSALMEHGNQPGDVPLDLSLDMPDLDLEPPAYQAPVATAPAVTDQAMDFDMSGLSLDLDQPSAPSAGAADPLATKLALAREFLAIGDSEGARAMASEVLQNASGDLKAQAEALLSGIR